MTSLSLPLLSVLLLAQLCFLATAILILHRLSTRLGLTPLLVLLGTLTAALQFRLMGTIIIQVGTVDLTLSQGSFILLPVTLLGLLIIYIVNGTKQARNALLAVVLVTLAFAFMRSLPDVEVLLGSGQVFTQRPIAQPIQGMLASALSLGADMIIMIIVYQAVSNLRNRYPSRTAATLALLAAIWIDAFLYPLLSSFGLPELSNLLIFHLGGKTLAVFALWPLLSAYIWYIAPLFPETAATSPRPTFDLFATSLQLEARARIHYSLLRTISQVNQLISRTSDPQVLLDRVCNLLVTHRDYALVWIAMIHTPQSGGPPTILPAVHAGRVTEQIERVLALGTEAQTPGNPAVIAALSAQALITKDHLQESVKTDWSEALLESGFRSSASFPMRHAGHTLGVLTVHSGRIDAFTQEEFEQLQELADDLAHALISLEARQQQAILHTAAETMQDGLFITNMAGRILYANPAIAQILGVEAQNLEGEDIRRVFPSGTDELPFDKLLGTLQKNEKADFDLEQPLPDRRSACFSIRASLAHDTVAQPAYIVINIRDITRHREHEHHLLTLNQFTTELVQTRDVQGLMEQLFSAGDALLNADASSFYLLDSDGHSILQSFAHNLPEDTQGCVIQLGDLLPESIEDPIYEPLFVSDVLSDPAYVRIVKNLPENVRALLFLPVLSQEKLIGVLVLFYCQQRAFSEDDIQLGLTLAHTLAISLENARLYQAEKSQREFAEGLASGAAALNSSLEFERVLDQILDQAIQVIQCRSVNLMLIEGGEVRVARHLDRTDPGEINRPVTGRRLPLNLPTLQHMLQTGEPLVIPYTYQDPTWQKLEQTTWIYSYAASPLQVQGRIIGFLNMNSDQPGFFSPGILPRLQAFADTAAAAIQNARLYKESQLRGEELALLVEAASVVSTSLDLDQVLQGVSEQMARMLNIRGCAISDYKPEANTVSLLTAYGPKEWVLSEDSYKPYRLEEYPLTRQVLESGKPALLRIDDAELDSHERKYMEESDIKTLLMLPLVTKDRTIGLVELIDDREPMSFTHRQIELVQTLAFHAATAIENALLYQQSQHYASELEDRVRERTDELRTAKERIEHILASASDAIIVLDEENHLLHANPAGEALQVQAEQQGLELLAPQFLQSLSGSNTPAEETLIQIQERAYQALASSISVGSHKTGTVIVFRDVTRFRDLDQMKTQFVSDVSHELRTPLTNLSLYLDLLTRSADPERNERYLATLRRETRRLTSLIEDLLTISRLEAGRVEINIEPVDINRVISDLALDRMQMAANQELTLTYTLHPDLPPAQADPRLVTQVLSNLLTNALNYTPTKHAVQLRSDLQEIDGVCWVTATVSDNGLGIAPAEMEQLFTRFFRGSAGHSSNAPGTGLGLAISKEIIERLDGRITVESQMQQGSAFTVWLRAVL